MTIDLGKRERSVTLTSVVLGLALLSKLNTDKDILPLLHLKMPVNLRMSSGSKGYNYNSEFVESGIIYISNSQYITDKPGLKIVKSRMNSNRKKMSTSITTIINEPLCAAAVVRQVAQVHNYARTRRSHGINFIITNIALYYVILCIVYL
jgi:hypothetical protein